MFRNFGYISRDCEHLKRHIKPIFAVPSIGYIWLIILGFYLPSFVAASVNQACLNVQTKDDSPTFMISQTICNYMGTPVKIYSFEKKIKLPDRDTPYMEFCLLGDPHEKFEIAKKGSDELVLILNGTLDVSEFHLQLHAIRIESQFSFHLRQTISEINFNFTIDDCNRITWQTLSVISLSSFIVLLLSTLAIMLILCQQKGLIGNKQHEEEQDNEKSVDSPFTDNIKDNTFINPRRTSSYEFSNISRHSSSEIDRSEIHEI